MQTPRFHCIGQFAAVSKEKKARLDITANWSY